MSLVKWGEIKVQRTYVAGIIGGIALGVGGVAVTPATLKELGFIVGLLLGFVIFHLFDPTKTIVYKYEEEKKPNSKQQ